MSANSESESKFVAKTTKMYNEKGQTSIPVDVRKRLDLEEGDNIGWVGYEDKVMVVKADKDE